MLLVDGILLLRGWHPDLAHAESLALWPDQEIERIEGLGRFLRVRNLPEQAAHRAFLAAGIEGVLCHGALSPVDVEAIHHIAESLPARQGSVAVRVWHHGIRTRGVSNIIGQRLGSHFVERGHPVDLDEPDHVVGVVIDGQAGHVACGWFIGPGPKPGGIDVRHATRRPFFRPISLDPRLARSMVNLTGWSSRRVLDPMCGTGGLLLEGALTGRHMIGRDLDPTMVQGSKQNLEWLRAQHVSLSDCTIDQGDVNALGTLRVDSVVMDPPYGRNTRHPDAASDQMVDWLESLRGCVPESGHLVMLLPIEPDDVPMDVHLPIGVVPRLIGEGSWLEVESKFQATGWTIVDRFTVRVHGSLARLLIRAVAC